MAAEIPLANFMVMLHQIYPQLWDIQCSHILKFPRVTGDLSRTIWQTS